MGVWVCPSNPREASGLAPEAVHVWTGRPALTAILRDAATWNLQLGVVKSFPAASAGEEPCRFGGQPGGKWQVVRAGWARGTCPVGGEESEMWSEGGE